MNGLKALATICASLAAALALCGARVLSCRTTPISAGNSPTATIFDQLRWSYERINFDDRPVDVAIVGPSRPCSASARNESNRQLAARGHPANGAISPSRRRAQRPMGGARRAFRNEVSQNRRVAVDGTLFFYGHPAFKLVAAAATSRSRPRRCCTTISTISPILPSRQVKLLAAGLFPGLFGLRKEFDPAIYATTRSEFTSGLLHLDNKAVDMDRRLSAETLREQAPKTSAASPLTGQLLKRCCSNDDHTYIKAIAEEARAHGVRLIFVFLPTFERDVFEDRDFLSQYGQIVDDSDMSKNPDYYENWSHFGHSGSMEASDRIASAIANMRTSKLDQGKTK